MGVALLEYQVPGGLVYVLRRFQLWFQPVPLAGDKSLITWSLTLNGADYPSNSNNPCGATADEETFMIADEFNNIGIRVNVDNSLIPLSGFDTFAKLYGNVLLKSGRPLPFEIANPVATGGIRTSAAAQPQQLLPKVPPPPPMKLPRAESTMHLQPSVSGDYLSPPPFPVSWQALPMGQKRIATDALGRQMHVAVWPIQNDTGQRRALSDQEVKKYFGFLMNIWPGIDGRGI